MPEKFDQADIIEKIIEKLIIPNGYPERVAEVQLKIDLLRRLLDRLAINNKTIQNSVPFEEAYQSSLEIKNGCIHFYYPKKRIALGSGTHPIRLQPKLLQFLLIHHKESYQIYDIIENFIKEVWNELENVDFKITKTGVTRCFTNTRFAANALRDYGFLKYTKKQAFKTWELSLSGFLVAAKIVQQDYKIKKEEKEEGYNINPIIINTWKSINTYNDFVMTFDGICEKKKDLFKSFNPFLQEAHRLLGEYWGIIENRNLSQKERISKSIIKIDELEQHSDIENFYKDLKLHLKIEKLFDKAAVH